MARIEERRQVSGAIAWRVSWRLDGRRDGPWQSVTVTASAKEAQRVALLAKAHGHALTRDQMRTMLDPSRELVGETVTHLVRRHVESLIIEDGTRKEYERTIRLHIEPTPLGRLDLASVTREHIRRWVRGEVDAGAAAKSIANRHGLLFAALNEAVAEGRIGLNPCRGVRLPRKDQRIDADDEMCFLTVQEVDTISKALPEKYRHIPWLLACTGLRWSELTALQVGDVDLLAKPPTLTVRRAWKKAAPKGWKLGPPKSEKSRRTIGIDTRTFDLLLPLVAGKRKTEFVLTTVGGGPLPHATFNKAWQRTLYGPEPKKGEKRAGGLVGDGLLDKHPTIHGLRHTNASWLMADPRMTLAEISRRLGHESQQMVDKVYGHLRQGGGAAVTVLDELLADQQIMAADVGSIA